MTIDPSKLPRGVRLIVFTSVDDGLSSATRATENEILRAIEVEIDKDQPRTWLLKGLLRELRRRLKRRASGPAGEQAS